MTLSSIIFYEVHDVSKIKYKHLHSSSSILASYFLLSLLLDFDMVYIRQAVRNRVLHVYCPLHSADSIALV